MRNQIQLFKIASKMFRRDWRRGDMLVLLFAIGIAMASVSVIFLVIDRIAGATEKEIADVLGADLVITSPREVSPEWLELAERLRLQKAMSVEFSSVLVANEQLQLSFIKAVSDDYPLKGHFGITDIPHGKANVMRGKPPRGSIWVAPEIYHRLRLKKGSRLELGYRDMDVAGVLGSQPGQGSTLFNIAPTTIMNIDDLASTQIIQPGSRVTFRYLFVGDAAAIATFADQVKAALSTSQRLVSIFDESPLAGSAIARSKKYIGLSSLLTMILLGVAISLSVNHYARKQFDLSALMRCFGMTNKQVLGIFIYTLFQICFFGIVVGGLVGIIVQEFVVSILAQLFVDGLPPANYSVLILPMMISVILLFGFSLPALIRVKMVPPMRALRRQLGPVSVSGWLVYITSGVTLVCVMWLQMKDLKLLFAVILGVSLVVVALTLLGLVALQAMKRLVPIPSAAVNFSLRQLDSNKGMTLLHLLTFSTTVFVIATIVLVRSELLTKWEQSLREKNAPNHFLYNIRQGEVGPLKEFFNRNNLIISDFYPMVRGRIVGINGEEIKTAVSVKGQAHNSLKRELNITWSSNLPKGNSIVEGKWGWEVTDANVSISLEEKTAQALGVKLGDRIDFTIGSVPWSASVTSIRRIDWQTLTPNFYVIARPGSLSEFHATYIASFFLAKSQKALLSAIAKANPSVTIVDFDRILNEVRKIIQHATMAVEVIMLFLIVSGVALFWAALEYSFEEKYRQSAILRTLGAENKFIARSFRFEYLWLALLSSLMGIVAVELVTYLLYTQVFDLPFAFHWGLWVALPLGVFVIMIFASWRGVKRVTALSPLSLLRQS